MYIYMYIYNIYIYFFFIIYTYTYNISISGGLLFGWVVGWVGLVGFNHPCRCTYTIPIDPMGCEADLSDLFIINFSEPSNHAVIQRWFVKKLSNIVRRTAADVFYICAGSSSLMFLRSYMKKQVLAWLQPSTAWRVLGMIILSKKQTRDDPIWWAWRTSNTFKNLGSTTNTLNILKPFKQIRHIVEPVTITWICLVGDFFTDCTMVNHHHFSPPFVRICLVHFFQPPLAYIRL